MIAFERELRRWTRLRPEILTRCRTRILDRGRKIPCALLDLSPGGIGLLLDHQDWKPHGSVVQVEIKFDGQPVAVRAADVRRIEERDGNQSLGLAWRVDPEPWNQIERRARSRLDLPLDEFLARTPLRHAHNVWTRLSIVDVSSDFGFQVETRGGPAYLLPGHLTELRLDLPHLHHHGWDCQILWIKPTEGHGMKMGMRVLDPDPALIEIFSEWLQIRRRWSPLHLLSLGFPKESLPGQYRFRKVEEIAERVAVANFFEDMTRRGTRTGMEHLHSVERISNHDTIHLGCWDGRRLVAALSLDTKFEEMVSEDSHARVVDFAVEPDWIVPEVFFGLWEQTVRLFLAGGNTFLWMWCPPGRDRLFRLAGLEEAVGPALPAGLGTWMNIHRNRLVSGHGMNAIRWALLYADVSGFVLRHQNGGISLVRRMTRLRKLVQFGILRDWREPRELAKLQEAVEDWAMEIHESSSD